MLKRWSPVLLLTVCVACLLFATYVLIATRGVHASTLRAPAQKGAEISQPQEWVPFSADVLITHADGGEPSFGRFYRDAHGCTRLETGPKTGPGVIFAKNIPRVEYYSWNKHTGQWVAGPMKLPSNGWKPIPRGETVVGLMKHPLFVEIRRGRPYSLRAEVGLTAYKYTDVTGNLSLQVPELNFFDVLRQTLEGRRETYSNVELVDQPEELFRPPAGASVTTTSRISGIVSQPTDTIPQHLEHMVRAPNR